MLPSEALLKRRRICSSLEAYGRMLSIAAQAWCNLEEATIFIALVILRVFLTEAMRFLTSLSDAMRRI